MSDILLHHDNFIFSYRVVGILIQNSMVLLQKLTNAREASVNFSA